MDRGKRVVITGVSDGLGYCMAREFLNRGHQVFGCARNSEKINEIEKDYSEIFHFKRVDVSDFAQVKTWADEVCSTSLPPDLLINNAAIINKNNNLWDISAEEFSKVMDINIKGTAHTIQAFVPLMVQENRGIIVNFSSGWGRSTGPEVAPYCASKWAIEGLSRSLSQELPSRMACIPLNPGIINTRMLKSCFGVSANAYPSPGAWSRVAVPFILKFSASDNGKPLTVPL
ncbi:SDR family oxidoreductase [Candidatus Riflebacteria bacterium]